MWCLAWWRRWRGCRLSWEVGWTFVVGSVVVALLPTGQLVAAVLAGCSFHLLLAAALSGPGLVLLLAVVAEGHCMWESMLQWW